MDIFPAFHFDGQSAAANSVDLQVLDRALVMTHATQPQARWPLAQLVIAEHFAHTPRMVRLPGGGVLEVPDNEGRFDAALQASGVLPSPVQRLQRHRVAAVIALAAVLAFAIFAYVRGIPAVARVGAQFVPEATDRRLGERLLAQADESALFQPSQLDDARRAELEQRFAKAARVAAPKVHYQVVWRRMKPPNDVNALTLPGGTIVMLDGLEEQVHEDDALVGIFGHELGHVANRHAVRQMIQVAGIGGLASMMWGDMSSVVFNGAVVLLTLDYTREMETEADEYAARVLRANGLSAEPLIRFLSAMEVTQSARTQERPPALLLTHPVTVERIQHLRDAMARP